MTNKKKYLSLAAIVVLLVLANCTNVETATTNPTPTATSGAIAVLVPSATPTQVPIPAETTAPTVTFLPTATAAPTATPVPTASPRPAPGYILGSDEWWDYVAPPLEFRQNSDVARSNRDVYLKQIYASTFVLQSWLNGTVPWEQNYGKFVNSTPFSELPGLAMRVFGEMGEVEESEPWMRPYLYPASFEEITFAIYVAWGFCLVDRTWDACELAIGEAIVEYTGLFGSAATPEPTTTAIGAIAPYTPSGGMLEPGDSPRPPSGALDTSKTYTATFITEAGDFEILLFDDEAPLTVENFTNLATIGFYDGTMFHRVIPQFMAQGGDPMGTGGGGPGYRFADEFDPSRRHDKAGVLSMANSGRNTNGSQFFITFIATPHLDDIHSVFGEVITGMDNVLKLRARDPGTAQFEGDKVEKIVITER